jgi:Cu2+-exporting ATPase
LEAIFVEQAGAVSCRVDSTAGLLHLRWEAGQCDMAAYVADVRRFGYLLGPVGAGESAKERPPLRPLVRKLGLCAALALNAMLFSLPHYFGLETGEQFSALFEAGAWLLATGSILVGGSYFFRRAWAALRRGELHLDLPISLGLIFAYVGSTVAWQVGERAFAYFDFVAIFTFLMLVGRWWQERSVESNRRRLLGLRLTPGTVEVLRSGLMQAVAAETLQAGERFRVGRGGLVPVRARLREEPGLFALNWINGEPAPRQFQPGSMVPSGARNIGSEAVDLLSLEAWSEGQLSRLLAFDAVKPWRNVALQKLIRIYLTCILILAGLGFWGWILAGGGWLVAMQVLISVLVVSCPCAIGVALPLLDDVAAARLQKYGVYLREGSLWGRLRKLRAVLFDKTGTLTLENLALSNPEVLAGLSSSERQLLLHGVRNSLHPVAGCLREALLALDGDREGPWGIGAVREILGQGLEWDQEGRVWRLGRATWAIEDTAKQAVGGTILSCAGEVRAVFRFREELRPEARTQVQGLRAGGIEVALLSGDEPIRVKGLAAALGLPEEVAWGGLTPEGKAELVRKYWPDGAMILGDGANDSLAFDAALCRGTPAVDTGLLEEKADFYLLGRSLAGLGELLRMGRRHELATRAVFGFALTYNAVAVGASLAGWMNPLVAAIIMPLSSLVSIVLVFAVLGAGEGTKRTANAT